MVRLEMVLLCAGAIAGAFFLAVVARWTVLPENSREMFRPESVLAIAVAVSILAGLIGIVLLLINAIVGYRNWLVFRVVAALWILFTMASIAQRV